MQPAAALSRAALRDFREVSFTLGPHGRIGSAVQHVFCDAGRLWSLTFWGQHASATSNPLLDKGSQLSNLSDAQGHLD